MAKKKKDKGVDPQQYAAPIPKAVQDAGNLANDLHNQITTPITDPPAEPPDPDDINDPTPGDGDPVLQPPEPPVEPPATPPVEDWEAKYKALEGKYRAEVPQLYNQIADLRIQIAEIARQKPQPPAEPPKPTVAEIPKELAYLRKELPEFEGAVNYMIEKRANELLAEKLGTIENKVGSLEATTVETAGNAFYKYLDDNIPNWRVINDDPVFMQWLTQRDRRSTATLSELMGMAYDRFDYVTVGNFFLDYCKEKGIPVAPKPKATPTPQKFVATPKGEGGGQPPPQPPADETMTAGQVKKFYDDVAAGKYKNREDEQAKMDAKIGKLMLEGKII